MKKVLFIILIFMMSGCGETPSPLSVKFDKGAKGDKPVSPIIHSFENNYNPNDMNGWTGKGASNNDYITNEIVTSEFCTGVKSLEVGIDHSKEQEGYLWLAFNLGPDTEVDKNGDPAPQKRDVSDYKYISFYIKVMQDRTKFYVELGDITTPVGEAIKVPVTIIRQPEKWQQVRIPLEDFWGLDLERVTKFIISMNEDIDTQENIRFYIDEIGFTQ